MAAATNAAPPSATPTSATSGDGTVAEPGRGVVDPRLVAAADGDRDALGRQRPADA